MIHKTLSKLSLLIASFAILSAALPAQAQVVYPTFKLTKVEGNANGEGEATINYAQITNASQSAVLAKINNWNRKSVFLDNDVLIVGDQAAANKMAEQMAEFYYDGVWAIPSISRSQDVQVVRGGKYVVFTTSSYSYIGGMHGTAGTDCTCYSLTTGDKIDLSYISTGSWTESLKRIICERCQPYVSYELSFMDWDVPYVWALTEFGVKFYYAQGELGCTADGIIEGEIRDDELRAIGVPIRW